MHAVTLTLALSVLTGVADSEAPCTNGSFERLAPNNFPADWGAVGQAVQVSPDAHSGQRALRFFRTPATETAETGLNRRPLIDRLKGGIDFWYKALSAKDTTLNIHVIAMDDEPREATGEPRATYTVPAGHIGDGRWHHGRLKYDFTGNPKAHAVHFAVRIVGSQGDLLVDDISYVEQVGKLLQIAKVDIEEDSNEPGRRCTIRALIGNEGDATAEAVQVRIIPPSDGTVSKPQVEVGDLAPDEQRWVKWDYEGERTRRAAMEFVATSADVEAQTSFALAPELRIHTFGPATPVVAAGRPAMFVCILENSGTASVVNPTVVYHFADGSVERTFDRLHPGEKRAFSTCKTFDTQSTEVPVRIDVSADNVDGIQTAETSLIVGSDVRPGNPDGELHAVVTDDYACLENENVRLLFRRNEFGFGPAELVVIGNDRLPKSIGWLPRLARLVVDGKDGSRREHVVLTDSPPKVQNGDEASLEFSWAASGADDPPCRVSVRFALRKGQKTISAEYGLRSSEPCKIRAFDGPMLCVSDRGEAVFPGLEWLVDDELSSSTLDIAAGHPHQVRYVVHPNMVTIPAVGIHGAGGTAGLLWDVHQKWDGRRDRPSVVFASPNRFENQRSHLVGLFAPNVPEFVEVNEREAATPYVLEPDQPLRITARIFADAEATDALAAVDEWIRIHGFPNPAPLAHGSYDGEIEFSMKAYLDSLWEAESQDWWTTKGGGMMSNQGRPPSFVADLLLGAQVSPSEDVRRACQQRAEEVLALIGGEPRIDAQRFRGRTDLAMANPAMAASMLGSLGKDGAWRFDADQKHTTGPFVGQDYHELGPDNAVELGTSARNAFEVLNYARVAGDPAAYEAMQKTLILMESFTVPRAAQVWEVPVHTPDVLAAADAVDAYVEAYRFSGDERWLHDAVTWARRGLPFIYLWNDSEKPFLVGGSIPVFGATWYQGSWFGRPVQWNGLRYANALLKLEEYDKSYPWRKLAEAIIRSAIHQQDLDGENVALWPDNISAIDCEKCPWVFAPRQIIRNVLKLTGRDEDPATTIVGDGQRRLHISSTAAISNATWNGVDLRFRVKYPPGEQGVVLVSNVAHPNAVLLDGAVIGPRADIEAGAIPGWRYDEANAYLAIRVHRDGPVAIEVPHARFRSFDRLPLPVDKIAFSFDESTEGWTAAHDVESVTVAEGLLAGRITGPDPYLIRMLVNAAGDELPIIRLRMRVTAGYGGLRRAILLDDKIFARLF